MQDQSNEALLEAARQADDPAQQSKIIIELGRRRVPEALDLLIEVARGDDYYAGAALEALGKLGDPRAAEVLVDAFHSPHSAWIAKDALVRIGPGVIEPVQRALRHYNATVRFLAARTLGELCDLRALAALERAMREDDEETNRQAARSALKGLLLAHLADPDPAARRAAVEGLGRLGDARTIDALQALAADDPDPAVAEAAEVAVRTLIAGVATDPFESHHLPLRSRETQLLLNRLHGLTGDEFAPVKHPRDLAGEDQTFETLNDVRRSPDEARRALGDEALLRLALDYLSSRYPEARRLGVQALTGLDRPAAWRRVRLMAELDPDPAVRAAAWEALAGQPE